LRIVDRTVVEVATGSEVGIAREDYTWTPAHIWTDEESWQNISSARLAHGFLFELPKSDEKQQSVKENQRQDHCRHG